MLKDYFLLTLLNYRQDYKLGTGIPVRAQRVILRKLKFTISSVSFYPSQKVVSSVKTGQFDI